MTSTEVTLIRHALIAFFFNCTSELTFLFHFIIITKFGLVKSIVIFIHDENQILATLLKYFLLRPVNQSRFLGHHKKEVSINVISIICKNCKNKKLGIIFGCISEYQYGLVLDQKTHKAL